MSVWFAGFISQCCALQVGFLELQVHVEGVDEVLSEVRDCLSLLLLLRGCRGGPGLEYLGVRQRELLEDCGEFGALGGCGVPGKLLKRGIYFVTIDSRDNDRDESSIMMDVQRPGGIQEHSNIHITMLAYQHLIMRL